MQCVSSQLAYERFNKFDSLIRCFSRTRIFQNALEQEADNIENAFNNLAVGRLFASLRQYFVHVC
jgi:hypothetical protein